MAFDISPVAMFIPYSLTFVLCLGIGVPPRKQLLVPLCLKFHANSGRFEFEVITQPLLYLQEYIQNASDLNPKTPKT